MNKLTKVGLSALCGSLAAVSAAKAGDMTVTGGADMSYVTGANYVTGNPIGMGSNLTFKGSGELDNGWSFDYTVAMLNQDAYSNSVVNIVMGGMGSININQGDSGNGIDAMDDKMPTAWEEPWGNVLGTGVHLVRGVGPEANIQYKSPTIAGITITTAMAHDMGAGNSGDKASSGNASGGSTGRGYDATVNLNPSFGTEILSGLNLFVGAHYTENLNETENDKYEGVAGATLDIGPISLGYATSGVSTGQEANTEVDYYKNHMYGVAFNINDNLSVSYGYHESQQGFVNPALTEAVHMDMDSYQIAYTIGGASIRYASTEVNNAAYQTGAGFDKEADVISVSLAF
jgi:outer membrane protein OmpU